MNAKKQVKIALIVVPICLLLVAFLAAVRGAKSLANQAACISNLKVIWTAVADQEHTERGFNHPTNLQALTRYCRQAEIFACPQVGREPGALSNVDQWSDYVFVPQTSLQWQNPKGVTAFCIPEHHGELYGIVVFNDGSVELVSKTNFWQTIHIGGAK